MISVIVPVYNEYHRIGNVINEITTMHVDDCCGQKKENIFIDDFSDDGTYRELEKHKKGGWDFSLIRNGENRGKGYSIRKGIEVAKGDIIIIQDADLEYDPNDWSKLIQPILNNDADVVYGSRFRGSGPKRVMYFKNYLANKFLTFMSNLFTGLNLTDMETGAKAFRADILKDIELKENGFGFEPEITAKVKKHRIYEVGISYYGRTYAEGKKIHARDGFRAIYCILRYNLWEGIK